MSWQLLCETKPLEVVQLCFYISEYIYIFVCCQQFLISNLVTDFGDKPPISWEYWLPCCVLMSISGTTGNFHFCRKYYLLHRACNECHYWFDELLMYAWMPIAFLPNSPPLISERMHCTLSEVITHTPFPLSTVITSISIAVCSVDTQTPSYLICGSSQNWNEIDQSGFIVLVEASGWKRLWGTSVNAKCVGPLQRLASTMGQSLAANAKHSSGQNKFVICWKSEN